MQDVFHRVGTFASCRLKLKMRCSGSPSSVQENRQIQQKHKEVGPVLFLHPCLLSGPAASRFVVEDMQSKTRTPSGKIVFTDPLLPFF